MSVCHRLRQLAAPLAVSLGLGGCASGYDVCPIDGVTSVAEDMGEDLWEGCEEGNILLCNPFSAAFVGLMVVFAAPVYFVPHQNCPSQGDPPEAGPPAEVPEPAPAPS